MLKKMITYEDFNGQTQTEPFYFNLSESELTEMELLSDGRLSDTLSGIIRSESLRHLVMFIKKLILDSYGVPSDDGKKFIKSTELSEDFYRTNAYDELFKEITRDKDGKAMEAFIDGVLPAAVVKKIHEVS